MKNNERKSGFGNDILVINDTKKYLIRYKINVITFNHALIKMEEDRNPSLLQSEKKPEKKKITITVDEDDPCIKKVEKEEEVKEDIGPFPTYDPRYIQSLCVMTS